MDLDTIGRWIGSPVGRRVVASLAAIALVLLIRLFATRWLRQNERLSVSERLRWSTHARNLAALALALAAAFIWGPEVRDFVVSLVVLASAIVLASKELIMCVSGSLIRTATASFGVGDRIEVKGIRGDVIDTGLLGTTILEIGPGHQRTGRTQVIPNSVLLSEPVANETFTDAFVLHTFDLPLASPDGWAEAEARLLAIATDAAAPHVERAREQMDEVSRRHGLNEFDVRPRVTLHPGGSGGILLLRVRLPTPARERGHLEQEVLRRFYGEARPATPRDAAE